MKIYTVITTHVFGAVDDVHTFALKDVAAAFVIEWANKNSPDIAPKFASSDEAIEWFAENDSKCEVGIDLFETEIEMPAINRDDFMTYFRSDTFHESISVDDAIEIFRGALHGSSDITKELLTETASDYDVNVLELFTVKELMEEIACRAIEENGVIEYVDP